MELAYWKCFLSWGMKTSFFISQQQWCSVIIIFPKCPLFLGASPDRLPSTDDHCSPNPCQNRAICRIRGDGYSCFCVPGFQGAHCQIDVNECVSQPCRNGATCVDRVGRFSCLCSSGFTGEWADYILNTFEDSKHIINPNSVIHILKHE